MLDFEKRLAGIAQQTILCVGDLMLDDFVYGEVGRISPEAPAPVLAVKRNEVTIGGAGNVARHIASTADRDLVSLHRAHRRRRFRRNARDLAIDEVVEHQVADAEDRLLADAFQAGLEIEHSQRYRSSEARNSLT